jgi:hypothetical protein
MPRHVHVDQRDRRNPWLLAIIEESDRGIHAGDRAACRLQA